MQQQIKLYGTCCNHLVNKLLLRIHCNHGLSKVIYIKRFKSLTLISMVTAGGVATFSDMLQSHVAYSYGRCSREYVHISETGKRVLSLILSSSRLISTTVFPGMY